MTKVFVFADRIPIMQDLHDVISEIMDENVAHVSMIPLSYDGVMKKIAEGIIRIEDMNSEMKLVKSTFFHCVITKKDNQVKEMYLQKFVDKIKSESDESGEFEEICKVAIFS